MAFLMKSCFIFLILHTSSEAKKVSECNQQLILNEVKTMTLCFKVVS